MFEYEWDVFISHASEDKESVARPLANRLAGFGLKVWLDESELHLGDSLREKIDVGLAQSRFGLVILSPAFFAKIWTKSELDGLVAKEVDGIKVILPIWHKLGHNEVRQQSPILAGRLAATTSEGLDTVATKIVQAIENSGSIKRRDTPFFEGRLTKKIFYSLPEGSFLLSNLVKPDLTPAAAEPIPTHHLRKGFWEKLSREGLLKTKCYVFEDAAAYRAHMASRNFYAPEEEEKLRDRHARRSSLPDFDIELARAYIAAGKSPPATWRPLIKSLSFADKKYKFDNLVGLSELYGLERLDLFDVDAQSLIGALSDLHGLQNLSLWKTKVRDLSPLRSLVNLRTLDIDETSVEDVSELQYLPDLRFLNARKTKIREFTKLKQIADLEIFVRNEPYDGKARIDLNEDWQTWYWTRHFGIDDEYLQLMVARHGNVASELQQRLRRVR
jgi:TIR domain/Protein of unknown function (DUF3606)